MCRDHPICTANYSPAGENDFLPTRLLAVGKPGDLAVRLVGNVEVDKKTRSQYTALSHCWGRTVPKRLLQANLDSMRQSISVSELPRNFQDAITITREIGVPYLWIDSLCIIQDSLAGEDWKKESVKMGLLYAHAYCTISATASDDCNGGCFFERKKSVDDTMCVLRRRGKRALVARSLGSAERQEIAFGMHFTQYVEQAPVMTRGWTFQERILASRVLHCCDGFVFFECNTLRASVDHVDGVHYLGKPHLRIDGTARTPREYAALMAVDDRYVQKQVTVTSGGHVGPGRHVPVRRYQAMKAVSNPNYKSLDEKRMDFLRSAALTGMRGDFQLLLKARGTSPGEKMAFHKGWYEVVEQYAGRNLTKDTDRIPAIVGVADFIEKSVGRRFVAGLWENTLDLNLLWNVKAGQSQARVGCAAPTWSWVSINGGVETKLRHHFNTEPPEYECRWLVSNLSFESVLEQNDWVHDARLVLSAYPTSLIDDNTTFIRDCVDTGWPLSDLSDSSEYLCLPLLALDDPKTGSTSQVHGIVVRLVQYTEDSSNSFARVGYFWTEEAVDIVHYLEPSMSQDSIVMVLV